MQRLTFGYTADPDYADLDDEGQLEGLSKATGLRSLHTIGCSVVSLAGAAPHLGRLTRLQLERCNVEGLDVSVLPALRELQLVECEGKVVGAERLTAGQGRALWS